MLRELLVGGTTVADAAAAERKKDEQQQDVKEEVPYILADAVPPVSIIMRSRILLSLSYRSKYAKRKYFKVRFVHNLRVVVMTPLFSIPRREKRNNNYCIIFNF